MSYPLPQFATEDVDSPITISRPLSFPNPFTGDEEDVLPSVGIHNFEFQGSFAGVTLGETFTNYHRECLARRVPITQIQDVL